MKISFDFDNTLEHQEVQDLAREMIQAGHNVCILTTRYSDPMNYPWAKENPDYAKSMHDNLFRIAKKLGITEINFTEYKWKTEKIDDLGIDIHIDDNVYDEVPVINAYNKARCIPFDHWQGIEITRTKLYETIAKLTTT